VGGSIEHVIFGKLSPIFELASYSWFAPLKSLKKRGGHGAQQAGPFNPFFYYLFCLFGFSFGF
jgi:hypothetical protein